MNDLYSIPGFSQPLSSMSHLIGACIFAALALKLLFEVRHDRRRFWCTLVFAFSAVQLLSISSVYHMFMPGGTTRAVMLRLDIAAIFLLIAGSFTPLHGILFKGWRLWGVLIPIWIVAITGLTLRVVFFNSIPKTVGVGIFLIMGWFGAISAFLIWKYYGTRLLAPIVAGGVLYTIGAISHAIQWPTVIPYVWGPHETHHFTVLAALGCHWWVVVQIATSTNEQELLAASLEETAL